MLALLLLLQAQPADLVVTGQRLVEVQAECARGGCTPLRDAQATIALAEAQFRDGAYRDAKLLLAAAVSRNRANAAAAPRAVAALYEAYATVSLHEGDQKNFRRAVANQVETLRDNLPADDPARISAPMALGDMWIKLGDYRQADATYQAMERKFLEEGRDFQAMMAGMKRVWLAAARGQSRESLRMLGELEARPIAGTAGFRTALTVLKLRIAARNADQDGILKLIADIGQIQSPAPVLIWAPPYESDAVTAANDHARKFGLVDTIDIRSSDYAGIQWADVGFWIRPDGHTAEADILRGSHAQGWVEPILTQISARRYAASDANTDQAGHYRIERFTKRTRYRVPTGSMISRRFEVGGFEILDLTQNPAAPPS